VCVSVCATAGIAKIEVLLRGGSWLLTSHFIMPGTPVSNACCPGTAALLPAHV